ISSIRNHRLAVRGVRNAFSRKRTPSLALPTLGVEALKPFAIIHASSVIEIAHAPASTSASHREKRRGNPVRSGCSGATLAAQSDLLDSPRDEYAPTRCLQPDPSKLPDRS